MNRIILTDPRVKDGTMTYFDEYVVLDFEGTISEDIIADLNYNIYIDGEKLDREAPGDLTKTDPDKYKTK